MKNIIDYVMNREWIAMLLGIETLVAAVLEFTDVMPDGQAKGFIVIVAGVITAWAARARVFSKNSTGLEL